MGWRNCSPTDRLFAPLNHFPDPDEAPSFPRFFDTLVLEGLRIRTTPSTSPERVGRRRICS